MEIAWPMGGVTVGPCSHRSEKVPLLSWSRRAREEFGGQLEAVRCQAGCGLAEATSISGCLVTTAYHLLGAMGRQGSPVGSSSCCLMELSHEITFNFIQDSNL